MRKNEPNVGFKLLGIKVEQFALFESNYNLSKETGLGTELQFKLDQNAKQIGVFLGFELFQDELVFLKIVVSCHFSITADSWNEFIAKKENKIVIPKGFLAHLGMITTGTTRGIMFVKTENTPYAKFIVPTLDVTEMIPQDAVFDILEK